MTDERTTDERRIPAPRKPPSRRGVLLGLALILTLIVAALLLAHYLRDAARLQDCVLSGRTDCESAPQRLER